MNLPTLSIPKIGSSMGFSKTFAIAPSIAAIVVSVLIGIFVVWPRFSEVLRLRTANEQLALRSQKLEEKAQKLQGLDKSLLERQLAISEQLMPSDKEIFSLVGQIERAAASSGVLLSRVDLTPGLLGPAGDGLQAEGKPAATPAKGGENIEDAATKVSVKVAVGSDYKSFLQFLSRILSMARVAAIKDLALASVSSESGQLRISFSIDAYWQSLPTELPSIESKIDELTQSELGRLEAFNLPSSPTGTPSAAPVVPSVPLG